MGWTNPGVLGAVFGGLLFLVAFVIIETKVENPMFQLHLFRIRAFTTGIIARCCRRSAWWPPVHADHLAAGDLAAPARLQLLADAAVAGIYLIPLTIGFLLSGPASGIFADRHGARAIATIGLIGAGICYLLLETLPMNFKLLALRRHRPVLLHLLGMFFSPNQMAVMNSLPASSAVPAAG